MSRVNAAMAPGGLRVVSGVTGPADKFHFTPWNYMWCHPAPSISLLILDAGSKAAEIRPSLFPKTCLLPHLWVLKFLCHLYFF